MKIEKRNKKWKNFLGFWDNGDWTYCGNFSQLWREYMWSAVKVLPNSKNISDLTKRDVLSLNLSWANGKFRWKCCPTYFGSVCHPWTGSRTKGVLKQELLGIQVTTFLEVITSEIFEQYRWCFFSKCAKFYVDCKNAIENAENIEGFWHNGDWTCCGNFSQLWREYMW